MELRVKLLKQLEEDYQHLTSLMEKQQELLDLEKKTHEILQNGSPLFAHANANELLFAGMFMLNIFSPQGMDFAETLPLPTHELWGNHFSQPEDIKPFPQPEQKRIEVEVDPDHSLLTQKTLVLGETDQPDDASFQGPNEQQVSSTTIVIHLEDAEKGPLENGGEPGFAPKLPEETPESEPQALKEPEAHDPNHDHPVPEGELPDPAPPSDAGMPSLGAAAGPAEPGPGSISELQACCFWRTAWIAVGYNMPCIY